MGGALENLGVSAGINLGLAAIFVACYSVASRLPINTRVYFPALFQRDPTKFKETGKAGLERFRLGFQLLDWLKGALKMPEEELISMAGLDAVMVLRVFFLSLKMLFPMAVWGAVVLIPINMTDNNVDHQREINPKSSFSSVDQLSLSNIRDRSDRMWAHLLSAYMFTFWAFYCLWKEYDYMTRLRLGYMADLSPQPDQFTVLATEIPAVNPQADETVSKKVARYFRVQYPDLYFSHNVVINANPLWALVNKRDNTANKLDALAIKMKRKPKEGRPVHKTGFLGLWGSKVDSIDFYEKQLSRLREEAATESNIIQGSQKRVVQSAFVTFRSRWGAAVAAQTQVSRNPQMWITEWAPEPRDVHWPNMGMPKWQRGLRRLIIGTAVFLMVFFYMVPISLVQSLANLNSIRSIGTPVKEIMDVPVIAGFVSGFLPGLVLKLFLALLPLLLRTMSTFEGHPSMSTIVKETCVKMYYFQLVNVFFGSILTGSLFQQLRSFLAEPTKLPQTLGNAIPSKSSFFITYIMVDGWAGFPAELLRLWPLLRYHVRVAFFVVTDRDRDNAMNVQRLQYEQILPSLLFYILLGLVYAPIAPLLLPFLLLFLVLGYVVYKNQIINVYERRYESCAGLWPFVTMRIISALLVAQITLLGVLSLKLATSVAPFALPLPVLTLVYSYWLRDRFEANFQKYPLESANAKDVIDRVKYPTWDLREISDTAYTHPALAKGLTLDDAIPTEDDLKHTQLVPIKARYKRGSNPGSGASTPRASRPSSPGRLGPPSITDDEAGLDHKV